MKNRNRFQLFAEGAVEGTGEGAAASAAPEAQTQTETAGEPAAREVGVDPRMVRMHWAGVERIYAGWAADAQRLQQVHPDFDLRTELKNPRFAGMLRTGVDMRSAYRALHGDEIIPAAMQYAAKMVEQRLAGAMRSAAVRPAENGLAGSGAVMTGRSVRAMSRQDYDKVCRMVERGERVSFG